MAAGIWNANSWAYGQVGGSSVKMSSTTRRRFIWLAPQFAVVFLSSLLLDGGRTACLLLILLFLWNSGLLWLEFAWRARRVKFGLYSVLTSAWGLIIVPTLLLAAALALAHFLLR
jgi:hypothetical protein